MQNTITALFLGSALLSGCEIAPPQPGAQESNPPPMLYQQGRQTLWDNLGSFGPVPASKAAQGAEVCAKLNTDDYRYQAVGYHSRAIGLDGQALPQGGFYCMRQKRG